MVVSHRVTIIHTRYSSTSIFDEWVFRLIKPFQVRIFRERASSSHNTFYWIPNIIKFFSTSHFNKYFSYLLVANTLFRIAEKNLFSLKIKISRWLLLNLSIIVSSKIFGNLWCRRFCLHKLNSCRVVDGKGKERLLQLQRFSGEYSSIILINFSWFYTYFEYSRDSVHLICVECKISINF